MISVFLMYEVIGVTDTAWELPTTFVVNIMVGNLPGVCFSSARATRGM